MRCRLLPAFQRRREISEDGSASRLPTTPTHSPGASSSRTSADLQMIVAVREAALAFGRQIEILDPLPGRTMTPPPGAKAQRKAGPAHPQPCLVESSLRIDAAGSGLAVMVAVIDHQADMQSEAARSRSQPGKRRHAT